MIDIDELQKFDELRHRYALNEQIDWFLKNFSPEDRDDAHYFYRSFMDIIQSMHRETQKPFINELNVYRNTMAMISPLVKKNEPSAL